MKFFTSLIATAVFAAAPAQANTAQFIHYANQGSSNIIRGTELIKAGDLQAGCALMNKGANQIAIANSFSNDQQTLDTYYSAKATIRNRC